MCFLPTNLGESRQVGTEVPPLIRGIKKLFRPSQKRFQQQPVIGYPIYLRPFLETSTFRTLANDHLIPGREATLLKAQQGPFPQKYTLLSLFRINYYAKHIPVYLSNIDEATGKTGITLS